MDLNSLLYTIGAVGGVVGVILVGLFALRVVATFDINKWQERKDERMRWRLRNACPHFIVTPIDLDGRHDIEIKSLVVTTFGTTDWFCTQCNAVFPGGIILPPRPKTTKDVEELIEQQKKFRKLARKAGYE